jgi:U4/U6 small nuclear ribonucleoprotein PRP4
VLEEMQVSSESAQRAKAEQDAILDHFEKRKKLRSIAVPTDDGKVRAKLREFNEPITLFGEGVWISFIIFDF